MPLHYDLTITGAICGTMWWPIGAKSGLPATFNINREIARFVDPDTATLRDVVDSILTANGGDFSSAQFTCDTVLTVARKTVTNGRRATVSRDWPITAFPSIADYVDTQTELCDLLTDCED